MLQVKFEPFLKGIRVLMTLFRKLNNLAFPDEFSAKNGSKAMDVLAFLDAVQYRSGSNAFDRQMKDGMSTGDIFERGK